MKNTKYKNIYLSVLENPQKSIRQWSSVNIRISHGLGKHTTPLQPKIHSHMDHSLIHNEDPTKLIIFNCIQYWKNPTALFKYSNTLLIIKPLNSD